MKDVYKAAVLEFGLWDQIRVDHGREFFLTLYVHEKLRIGRGNTSVSPYTRMCNHVIERMWVELNHQVTYPIKRVLTSMNDQQQIEQIGLVLSMQDWDGEDDFGMEFACNSKAWCSKCATRSSFSYFTYPPSRSLPVFHSSIST